MPKKINDLIELMARLRAPEGGCPWDKEQTFETIAPYTIEEAYEVADAIVRADYDELRDELGDLLFQIVFHAQMAQEEGRFGFDDVVEAVVGKMTRRHPHVFGEDEIHDAEAQTAAWEQHKAKERAEKAADEAHSVLDGVARTLPALTLAEKFQKRAARVGFDWPEAAPVADKVIEELDEIKQALEGDAPPEAISDEVGDLLFSCVNLARHLGLDPETTLRTATLKFERRFRAMEKAVKAQGRTLDELDLESMDVAWEAVKKAEKHHA